MKFRLFIGGMEWCGKDSALMMMFTDVPNDVDGYPLLPHMPKILYAVGVPLIWFWGELYDSDHDEPALPTALNQEYFTLTYDYTVEEMMAIVKPPSNN